MKRVLLTMVLFALAASTALAQYPEVTVPQIQQVPAESLAVADSLPNFTLNPGSRWTVLASPYNGDTVKVTALVAIPPGVITYTAGIWTMLLYDTAAAPSQWGGMLLRAAIKDTNQLKIDGFLNVEAGDIISLVGVISEFPTNLGYSCTQIQPIPGYPITIHGSAPLPNPVVKTIGDFYTGIWSTGKVQYTTGDPYEGMWVEFHNVVVNNKVSQSRGTFSFVDATGNELSDYDWSHFFTLGHGTTSLPLYSADTTWSRIYAAMGNGTRIDTIRGIMTTASGQDGSRGYRVAPIYPSDIVFAEAPTPPLIASHRRNAVVVSPDSSARISVRVSQQTNGSLPKTIQLYYSTNYGAFTALTMAYQASDSTYLATIPQQTTNTLVRYFVAVADSFGQTVRLANSSTNSGIAADTSKGFFFYTSLVRALTIQDVQYTPYVNGRTPYLGAVISLSGIVTGDTTKIGLSPVTTGSTNAWYMQSTNAPWSGIWLTTSDTTAQKQMAALRNGDSVAVTGTVQEQFDVTRLGNITSVVKQTSGNAEPAPVVRTTGAFSVGNGTASAEAYEGMLVRFNNVTVTSVDPTFSDPTEFTVNDGSGAVVVQRSGMYSYSNVAADSALGKTVLKVGNKIGSLTGIVYYSFSQYKFVPRTNADFVNVTLTGVNEKPVSAIPASYTLNQNYPNPFNPSTTIRFALPSAGQTTLRVYNLLGQEMATLVNDVMPAGVHSVSFNASSLSSGVYFFRIESGAFRAVKKMMLVK
jgi:hypothetical protein